MCACVCLLESGFWCFKIQCRAFDIKWKHNIIHVNDFFLQSSDVISSQESAIGASDITDVDLDRSKRAR